MNLVLHKFSWLIMASIVFSLMMLSNSAYAELPKAIQADKYKLLISDSLKSENYKDALKYIKKLEALKVKVPDSIMYYKGESWFHTYKWNDSKKILEKYLIKTGTAGKYYKEALVLLGKLEKDIVLDEEQKRIYGTPLHFAAAKGMLFQVKSLLDNGTYFVNAKDQKNKWTPLHRACIHGNYKVVKELIARGAIINVSGALGSTPLTTAIYWSASTARLTEGKMRHFEVVELLIKNGADVNARKDDENPLYTSVDYGKLKITELLIASGAKLNTIGEYGETALDVAKRRGHDKIVTLLKKHGAKTGDELKESTKE